MQSLRRIVRGFDASEPARLSRNQTLNRFHHEGTKHTLSKVEGNTKFTIEEIANPSRPSCYYNSTFARLAQMFRKLKTLGFGYSSRQDAEAVSPAILAQILLPPFYFY